MHFLKVKIYMLDKIQLTDSWNISQNRGNLIKTQQKIAYMPQAVDWNLWDMANF